MSINYYDKYIIYKSKYLELKNTLNQKGGRELLTPEEIDRLFDNRNGFGIDEIDEKKYANKYSVSTYGELTLDGLLKIIEVCKKLLGNLETKNFIDLGSGTGRVVFNASIFFNLVFGYELSTKRHNIGLKILRDNRDRLRDNINLENINLYDSDCSNIDVVYISSLCFTDEMMEKLKDKLSRELKSGSLIFTSKEMDIENNEHFVELGNIDLNVKMSWSDNSKLYVYKKV